MSSSYAKPSDLRGREICFLLDVEYQGSTRRFSTFPIDIEDLADETLISYNGGLNDPDITEQTSFVGFDLEANSVSMELVFYDVDWVAEWTKGRLIDNSVCTISMITVEQGQTTFTTQSKVVLFKGKAIGGIFGVPDKPLGFIAFTIENQVSSFESKKIIPDYAYLENLEFNLLWTASEGKVIPWVFGRAGGYPRPTSEAFDFVAHGAATPAYLCNYTDLSFYEFLVSYDLTQGGNLRIWDSRGGNFVNPIEIALDSDGNLYSYVSFNLGGEIEDNNFYYGNEETTYWADWSENDGSISSPYSDGVLEGAGDICLYALDKSGLEYDEAEWQGLRLFLNQYKFAGYVNDTDLTWWDWLKDAIIKYLPIEVVNGGYGIKPVLNMYFYSQSIEPNHVLTTSGDFEVITGLQPLDADPVNKINVYYALNNMKNSYQAKYVVDPEISFEKQRPNRVRSPLSDVSYEQYGARELTIEIDHCYDLGTAIKITNDTLRIRAIGAYGIDISAAPRYGYIMLGDIISLTSDVLGISAWKCQVIAKRWESNRWIFTIFIENNNFINLAQI